MSSGEPCLVASPVVGLTAGCVVQTTRGVPHLSLSQHLARAGQQYEAVSRWLAGVPRATAPQGTELPLRRALSELRDVAADRTPGGETFEAVTILSRVELCLSRFVDQFQYLHGIHAEADPGPGSAAVLGKRFGLTEDDAALLARSGRGTDWLQGRPSASGGDPTWTVRRCRISRQPPFSSPLSRRRPSHRRR